MVCMRAPRSAHDRDDDGHLNTNKLADLILEVRPDIVQQVRDSKRVDKVLKEEAVVSRTYAASMHGEHEW